uniref:SAC domain-containing protein n=1 Tax=Caenorhabditis tropicalis TaxID=1561998 RepID=A0A1I7UZT1_9PELO
MLIYTTPNALILEERGERLHFGRKNGELLEKPAESLAVLDEEVQLCGEVEFLVGKISFEEQHFLFFVVDSSVAAHYRGTSAAERHEIRRIERVIAINLKSETSTIKSQITPGSGTKLKQGTEKIMKFFTEKVSSKDARPPLLEDVLKLFNDSKDFYFCRERDVTISSQKFFTKRANTSEESFFWNKNMLKALGDVSSFTCPVMQGFVATSQLEITDQINAFLTITIISRRSTRRAGARYLRRGIDELANVANFVETELILNIFEHELSFVQCRGSIPVFWSQRGFKYRPPLIINRSLEDTQEVFEEHFRRLKAHYDTPLVAVSLVDQRGREHPLAQRFLEHLVKANDADLTFFSFDLHQHCRGLNFQKLQTLISSMEDTLKTIGFCWVDKTGEVVQRQKGVIRTNCIDCLDRTNLVQGQISLYIVLQQAQRLGIFGPLCEPPEVLVQTLQTMWADNGDVISTQYAGTAALKGDVTRNGERKLMGVMKDGYNSASRYYLTHTRDAQRQKAINIVTGQVEVEERVEEEENEKEEEENISRMVTETIQFLVPTQQTVIAGWGLINACQSSDEIDTVVILTRTNLYIVTYEIDGEKMTDVQIVALEDINSIQVGSSGGNKQCARIETLEGVFIWRPSTVRLFNNAALRLKSLDESNEYIASVAEQIQVGKNMLTGADGSVIQVAKISIPQMSVHRKSMAAMGALLGKIKRVGKNVSPATLSKSASTSSTVAPPEPPKLIETDGNESDTSEKSEKGDHLMSKFLKIPQFKSDSPPEPFASLLLSIAECQTKISLL